MENYSGYTKEELEKLINDTIDEYNAYRDVIAQAYEAMGEAARKYTEIMNELNNR